MGEVVHTLHVLLAGVWLGGVVFTLSVVSPALKTTKWSVAERVEVRSTIGKHYARVGGLNLVLLLVFAVVDGVLGGFGAFLYFEYALLAVLFGLVAAHGAYFGRRLRGLARVEREVRCEKEVRLAQETRQALQKLSFAVSMMDLLVSVVVMVLAVNARA